MSPAMRTCKRKRWVEHFEGVVNCSTNVSETVLQSLPVISPREDSSVPILTEDPLGSPLTEEELRIAISQLNSGKAPVEDKISAEVLRLGGESVVEWLKHLADCVWREEAVPKDWKKSLLIPLHKAPELFVITIVASHCLVSQARSSAGPSPTVLSLVLSSNCVKASVASEGTWLY